MEQTNKQLLETKAAAAYVGISAASLRNWTKQGLIHKNNDTKYSVEALQLLKKKIFEGEIQRLKSRVNKQFSTKKKLPKKYFQESNPEEFKQLLTKLEAINLEINAKLFLLALKIAENSGEIKNSTLNFSKIEFKRTILQNEFKIWKKSISTKSILNHYKNLQETKLPNHNDLLGLTYQSLRNIGEKSRKGAYFTPKKIVDKIANDHKFSSKKILDPSCGSGQFLLAFAEKEFKINQLFGFDIDPIAVKIARMNLLFFYSNENQAPNIHQKDFLSDEKPGTQFDLIVANPPWGKKFNIYEKKTLIDKFPNLNSTESFSLFLEESFKHLKENGQLSFLLPRAAFNVKQHENIRKILLNNYTILRVLNLRKAFDGVMTEVIRLDIKKQNPQKFQQIHFQDITKSHQVMQSQFAKNFQNIIPLKTTNHDFSLIQKAHRKAISNLNRMFEIVLGIVTGNNKKHLQKTQNPDNEEIITGKEIQKYTLRRSQNRIFFQKEQYQQCVEETKLRTKPKLVFKFISKRLVFALETEGKLCLNSANILNLTSSKLNIKILLALLNSSLYQFLFQKQFESIKVLKSHLEQLPFPNLSEENEFKLIQLVDLHLKNLDQFEAIDNLVFKLFEFNEFEKNYILQEIY